MPSPATITASSIYVAASGETITSARWNTNLNFFRGHNIPIDASTVAAATNTYDLGNTDHKWRDLYLGGSIKSVEDIVPETHATHNLGTTTTYWSQLFSQRNHVVSSTNGSLTLTNTSDIIIMTNAATATVTLPAANTQTNVVYLIKKTAAQVKIVPTGADTIDSTASTSIFETLSSVMVGCDGVNWNVLSCYRHHDNSYRAAQGSDFTLSAVGYASGRWAQLSGNYLTLDPGPYILFGSGSLVVGGTYSIAAFLCRWALANGDNTNSNPTVIDSVVTAGGTKGTLVGVSDSGFGSMYLSAQTLRVYLSATTTVYLNLHALFGAAGTSYMWPNLFAERMRI